MKNLNSMRLIILLIMSVNSMNSFSQNVNSNGNDPTGFVQLQTELQGKFQIQMIGTRAQPAISQELLNEIKNLQHQTEKVFFDYKPAIRIMILSKDEVSNGIIIPQEEAIIYIN